LAFFLFGASQQDADLYVMINASDSDQNFQIQEGRPGQWQLVFDTGRPSPADFPDATDAPCLNSLSHVVGSRSIVGLIHRGA
jgi:glycogen operon protein